MEKVKIAETAGRIGVKASAWTCARPEKDKSIRSFRCADGSSRQPDQCQPPRMLHARRARVGRRYPPMCHRDQTERAFVLAIGLRRVLNGSWMHSPFRSIPNEGNVNLHWVRATVFQNISCGCIDGIPGLPADRRRVAHEVLS